MQQNVLSISGTVTCISGSDAYAPQPYWDTYTHRQLTQNEIDGLIDNNYFINALSLSPGEYTCLEITFNDPLYVGRVRSYGDYSSGALKFDTVLKQSSKELSYFSNTANTFDREDIRGVIGYWDVEYWDAIDASRGYFGTTITGVGPAIPDLVSSIDSVVTSGDLSGYIDGVAGKTIRQVIYMASGVDTTRILFDSPVGYNTELLSAKIGTIDVDRLDPILSYVNTADHDVRSDIRYWVSNSAEYGHFEGERTSLSPVAISGTWDQYVAWSGTGSRVDLEDKNNFSFRQLIPTGQLSAAGDGIRITLSGSENSDVIVDNASFMLARSEEIFLSFDNDLEYEQTNIRGPINRWKQDSGHWGHFEGPPITIVSGSTPTMYDANVIGIDAEDHDLDPGDYVCIENTNHYDGYSFVLEFHHSNDHFTIWGIYDYEVFGGDARVRKVISLGPGIDAYGNKRDARDVLPLVEVNFSNGMSGYIIEYSSNGRANAAVNLGPDEYTTDEVTSIYDLTLTNQNWLSNTPGPGTNPDYESSMPNLSSSRPSFRTGWREMFTKFTTTLASPDPAYGYSSSSPSWYGDFFVITEAEDPALEGDWTGWTGSSRFYDRVISQPWWVVTRDTDCIWLTLCYRGPVPVKFGIDFKRAMAWDKHRFFIQLVFCPEGYGQITIPSKPKKWKLQASNNKNAPDDEWVTIKEIINLDPDEFVSDSPPLDKGIPQTSATGPWFQGEVIELYRYYRFYIEEVWVKSRIINIFSGAITGFEACHISEIDFVQHQASAGIFPTIVTANLFIDEIKEVRPSEHLIGSNTIYYSFSFDEGETFKVWDGVDWQVIIKNDNGNWKYRNENLGFSLPEDNNARKALWHALCVPNNRMQSTDLINIPEEAYMYSTAAVSGTTLHFGVGLMSTGDIECMLKGITLRGTIFDPSGETEPQEITFSGGQSGCVIPANQKVTSDWMNFDALAGYDLLFALDMGSSNLSSRFQVATPLVYFERYDANSYYLKDVNLSKWTRREGVVLIDSVDVRQHDTVTITASGNLLSAGDYVRIYGTGHYDHNDIEIKSATAINFDIDSKHWVETPGSGYVTKRIPIGPAFEYSDVQEGSLVCFSDTGSYTSSYTEEVSLPSGMYIVTENVCVSDYHAWNLFDTNENLEFHSGQQIEIGPIYIGLELIDGGRSFNKYRVRASRNQVFWEKEFAKEIQFAYSTESSPDLTNESHWIQLSSGTYGLPIGPGELGAWEESTCSGSYYHFRFKIDSNYGNWYDAIRLAEIEVSDSQGGLGGFTAIVPPMGAQFRYLLDDNSYNQYSSGNPNSGNPPELDIDFKNKKRILQKYRFKSIKNCLYSSSYDYSDVFPQYVYIYGSNQDHIDLNTTDGWTYLTEHTPDQPSSEGAYSDWNDVSGDITEPYRHYCFVMYPENGALNSSTAYATPDMTWYNAPAPYVISASHEASSQSFPAWKAFDRDYDTYNFWEASTATPCWIKVDFGSERVINKYRWRAIATSFFSVIGSPSSWSLQASKDNSNWVTLHSVSNGFPGSSAWTQYYTFSNRQAYRYYRMYITACNKGGGYYIAVAEIHLIQLSDPIIEISHMDIAIEDTIKEFDTVYYTDSFPYHLLTLPAYHSISNVQIETVEGMYGGYTDQLGTTATGVENVSFVTMVDRNNQLDNGKAISHIGIYADYSSSLNITFKMFKALDSPTYEWYDIEDIVQVTHSGNGFQWFELSTPEVVEDTGEWYLGWYQPEFPVTMGNYDASPKVAFEYGNYVGTLIHLQETADFKPSLAFRYAGHYTLGTESDPNYFFSTFSPVNDGQTLISPNTLDAVTSGTEIYIYQPCTFTQADTQGELKIKISYIDEEEADYEVPIMTVTGTKYLSIDNNAKNIIDGNIDTDFNSIRKVGETDYARLMFRFNDSVLLDTIRVRPSNNVSLWDDYFPRCFSVQASNSLSSFDQLETWEELYKDEGVPLPDYGSEADWSVWMYFDFYDDFYKYYLISFYHWDYATQYVALSDIEFVYTISGTEQIEVYEDMNVIYQITASGGQHDSGTKLLYNSGDDRAVSNVYNTYTDYSQIEVSPGSHFYRGENNLGSLMDRPVAVYKEVGGIKEQINITYPEFAGMGLMAWHPLNEEFGNFSDRSGNSITAYRVGTVGNEEARRYGTGGSNVDGDDSGYARFTLPHHVEEYTICFWFKPGISLYKGCPYSYDIMGGWTSYGAILGNWHISVGRSFLFDETPYPDTQIVDHIPPGDEDEMGCIYFGNYGGYVRTSRNYWSSNIWYHIAFNSNSTGPYKVWINGQRDDDYVWETASDVYPPSEAMIVDPDDIHYSDYGKSNCMYFGLPMKGSLGKRGKFALSDVMHFSQILDDYQVLEIFRMSQQLSEEWDTVYFAETEELQPTNRIIVDFGQEVAINKYAFVSPLELTSSGVDWDFTASGILGWEDLDNRVNDISSALGSEYATDIYYIEAIDSFPMYVFTTPAHKDAEVHWEVEIPFQGGYNDEWEGGGLGGGGLWGDNWTHFRTGNYQTLISGRYIARGKATGWWSEFHPDRRVQFKLGHRDSATQWDIINLGDYVYLSSSEPHEAVKIFDPPVKIEGDNYYPGAWSANSLLYHAGEFSYMSYKSGNLSGDNITGFTEVADKRPAISIWYSNIYSVGTDDDNEFVFSNMQPYAITESGSINISAGPPTQIFMYWNGTQADATGKIKITVTYAKDPNIAIGQWYNIHNRDQYQYYAFKFNSTTSDYISLTGFSTRSSPILLTVSGDYSSVTSGIEVGTAVLDHGFVKYEPGSSSIDLEVLRSGSWLPEPSGICGWEAVGSGDISIRSTFSTVAEYNNPKTTNYLMDTTSWVATSNQANIYFNSASGCTITGGEPKYSDWLHYFTDDNSYHVIDMELSGASDRVSYTGNGYGALLADYHTDDLTVVSGFEYTCSGIYIIRAVDGRKDEVIRITVDSTEHISIGDDIKLYGYFNDDYYEVLDYTSNTIDIQAPHPYTTLSGIYNKRIWPEDSIIGAQAVSDYDTGYISAISGALVVMDENFYATFINAIYNLSISGTALINTTTSGVTSAVTTNSGQWTFLHTGRVVSVDVKSDEPAGTFISHGVSFDGRNSFYIYESGAWVEIAKLAGQWKYYDGLSWQNAYKNNLLSAVRQAVDDGGYLFITSDLESVEESEWHKTGAIETVSGSLDFVQIMYGDGTVSPVISGYEVTFVQRSGIDSLIPDDYAYDLDAGELRGTLLNDIRLEPDTNTEIKYDRKYIDHIRLYVYNDQASGINMQEVALLDYQVPNDSLYLDPYSSLTYQYPLYNTLVTPYPGYSVYSSGITFDITSLRDEHILTGGITLAEQEQVKIQASGIPDSASLFYGQLRIYYDTEMGPPSVGGLITGDFYTDVGSGTNYIYNFFLSNAPINEVTIELYNPNPTGSGIQRIHEIGVYDYYPDYWEIPNEFNLLETAYTFDKSSSLSYLGTGQTLSPANLQKLIDPTDKYSIPIFTNCYIAVESQLTGFHGKAEELRLYLDRPIEHEATFYTQISGNSDWNEHSPTFFETDGEGYYYQKFDEPTNITGVRVLCANTSSASGTGLTIEYTYYVNATETFPYHLITFPKSVTVKSVSCEVELGETGMRGGYYGQYCELKSGASLSNMGSDTGINVKYSHSLTHGRYIAVMGKYTSNSFSYIKWKTAQKDNNNQFDIRDLETQTSNTGGLVWFTLSTPWLVPDSGNWYPSLYTSAGRNDFWDWDGNYETFWKQYGDAPEGDNITGWYRNGSQYYAISARYSTYYSIGDGVDPDRFLSNLTPVVASYSEGVEMDEDLIPGTQIWVYQTADSPDTSGRFKVILEVSVPTVAGLLWSKSIQLINSASGIDFGITGTSGNTVQLETYYRDHERIAIYNNSPFQRSANARLLPRFSNNYDLDRTIKTSKDGSDWRGLNDGICIPEDIPYDMGYHSGVYTTWDEKISLNTGVASGNWTSPIMEILDPSSTAAYIYTNEISETASFVNVNNESVLSTVEVRASNTKPLHIFMVTAFNTDSTTPAPWKEIYFDSGGNLITWTRSGVPKDLHRGSLSNAVGAPIRYWPMGYQPLWQFWSCLEPSGRGAICMGLEWSGDSGAEESDYDEDWYTIRRVFPKDSTVTDADGLDSSHVHIFKTNYAACDGTFGEYDCLYPRVVPIFNRVLRHVERYQGATLRKSWQMVDIVYRPEPFYERYQEDYYSNRIFHLRNIFSYNGTSATPEENNEIDYLYSFSQGDYSDLTSDRIRCAGCIDGYAGGLYYWVHFSVRNSYYRILLVNGTSVEKVFTSIEKSFNFMCEGAPEANRGFWGITNTSVAWYEYNGSTLSEVFSVYTDGTKNFSFVTHGATDYNNNLWFIDLSTERVMRVNFETQEVDYSREIRGACSVYPDPHDESAYIYVIRDPQFPYNDCIKIVHASEYDYIEPEVVCAVPGIALVEPFNVRLTGRSLHPDEDYEILSFDPVWGDNGIKWNYYSVGSPTLPKEQYKQFKITLQRISSDDLSPELDKIRIPKPTVINKIPYKDYKWIYVDTIEQSENTELLAGEHTADLLLWWINE